MIIVVLNTDADGCICLDLPAMFNEVCSLLADDFSKKYPLIAGRFSGRS